MLDSRRHPVAATSGGGGRWPREPTLAAALTCGEPSPPCPSTLDQSQRLVADTSPNAQVSAFMVTSTSRLAGTRTAAGPKPSPQQPVKIALATSFLAWRSVIVNSGELPKGAQP